MKYMFYSRLSRHLLFGHFISLLTSFLLLLDLFRALHHDGLRGHGPGGGCRVVVVGGDVGGARNGRDCDGKGVNVRLLHDDGHLVAGREGARVGADGQRQMVTGLRRQGSITLILSVSPYKFSSGPQNIFHMPIVL